MVGRPRLIRPLPLPLRRPRTRERITVIRARPHWLDRYMVQGEVLVVAVHAHIMSLALPVLQTLGVLVLTILADINLPTRSQGLVTILWLVFFAALVRMGWLLLEWSHDWFISTNKRLLRRENLITNKVSMMPLMKVTDMRYERTFMGQLLGYGDFVMESAGQEQALRHIGWVPNPDDVYRAIVSELFAVRPDPEDGQGGDADDDDDELDDELEDGDGRRGDGRSGGGSGDGGDGAGGGGDSGGGGPRTPVRPAGGRGNADPIKPASAGWVGQLRRGGGRAASNPVKQRRRGRDDDSGPISRLSRQESAGRGQHEDGEEWVDPYPDVASTRATGNPVQDRINSWSQAIPVRAGESVYTSEDRKAKAPGRKAEDTGPVSLYDDSPRDEPTQ